MTEEKVNEISPAAPEKKPKAQTQELLLWFCC